MRKLLIVGATSAMAQATARLWAADGDQLFLVARNAERLRAVAEDLRARGAVRVESRVLEATDWQAHAGLIDAVWTTLGGLDAALIAHGSLPDQHACQEDVAQVRRELEVNALSVLSLLTHLANRFETQGHGALAVIASVAGDRGRRSNYVYGAAKSAVSVFLQGLRNRLHPAGVRVVTIKPGFVDTPMTADFPKGPLWASPQTVARGIYKALERGPEVVYLPGFWRWIMLVIRLLPESLFKRLTL